VSENVIRATNLVRKFKKVMAVDGANFEVPAGSAFGLFGTNGAGKTTTIRMLLGLLPPTTGGAEVLSMNPRKKGVEIRRRTGYIPEQHHFYEWMKVRDLIKFTSAFYPTWNTDEEELLVKRFELDPDKKIKELSKGMVAKLALTLGLSHKPELLVLDEPTSGLDPIVRREFIESMIDMINRESLTIFISSHLISEVENLVDRVAIMKSGKILFVKTTEELKAKTRRVRLIFDEVPENIKIPGALTIKPNGRSVEAVFADWSDETGTQLKVQLNPNSIEAEPMGLEDIFIAYVGKSE